MNLVNADISKLETIATQNEMMWKRVRESIIQNKTTEVQPPESILQIVEPQEMNVNLLTPQKETPPTLSKELKLPELGVTDVEIDLLLKSKDKKIFIEEPIISQVILMEF